MMPGFVDSTVIIHLLCRNTAAWQWLNLQPPLGVTPVVWLEVIHGARGKSGQADALALLQSFEMTYLTDVDQQWSMDQLSAYRLSRGVEINDCLIASVRHRLQTPLYTHNVKHMVRLLDPQLVIQPY
jgi:predicted nucleic acid-binding protein